MTNCPDHGVPHALLQSVGARATVTAQAQAQAKPQSQVPAKPQSQVPVKPQVQAQSQVSVKPEAQSQTHVQVSAKPQSRAQVQVPAHALPTQPLPVPGRPVPLPPHQAALTASPAGNPASPAGNPATPTRAVRGTHQATHQAYAPECPLAPRGPRETLAAAMSSLPPVHPQQFGHQGQPSAQLADTLTEQLRQHYPHVLIWYGEATGSYWAMPLSPEAESELIEARDPAELASLLAEREAAYTAADNAVTSVIAAASLGSARSVGPRGTSESVPAPAAAPAAAPAPARVG